MLHKDIARSIPSTIVLNTTIGTIRHPPIGVLQEFVKGSVTSAILRFFQVILECKWGPLGLKSLLVGERCYEVIGVTIRHSKAHVVWEA